MDDQHKIRISELLLQMYDGSAVAEDVAEMEAMLGGNQEALEYYAEASMDLNYFHTLGDIPVSTTEDASKAGVKDIIKRISPKKQWALLKIFGEYEKNAPTMEMPECQECQPLEEEIEFKYPTSARSLNKLYLVAASVLIAILVPMFIITQKTPVAPYGVATISGSRDAQWSSDIQIEKGGRMISNSAPIQLTSGVVEFVTDDQVRVVLRAPAEFYFVSESEVSMDHGRLFASVGPQGIGFTVETGNTRIIDLGTEFGVVAHLDGNTEVHMYKGKAKLFVGEKDKPKAAQILKAGSARVVAPETYKIRRIALDEEVTARTITQEDISEDADYSDEYASEYDSYGLLVDNGGFEDDTTGWAVNVIGDGSTVVSSTESPLNDMYSAKFVTDWQKGTGVKAEILQTVLGLVGETEYELELWAKGSWGEGGVAWAEIQWLDENGMPVGGSGLIHLTEDLSETVYQAYGGLYTTPAGTASGQISIRLEGGALPAVNTLYVDEVFFE